MEIVKDRAQHPNEDEDSSEEDDSQRSEESAEPVRRKKRASDREASAKHSRLREGKAKVNLLANSGCFEEAKMIQQFEAEKGSNDERMEKNKGAKRVSIHP